MSLISYTLTAIVVFLALFLGVILAHIAREELKPGRKYLVLSRHLVFFGVIAAFLYYFIADYFYISIAVITLVLYFVLKKKRFHDVILYIMFGVMFHYNLEITYIIPCLMFIYGLLHGTLLFDKIRFGNVIKTLFIRYVWFLIIALGLFLI